MPVPTADEIRDAAAEIAVMGVQSATTDGQTTVAMDPMKIVRAADAQQARELLEAANNQGGPRSPWAFLRPAQAVSPGAT